MRHNMEGDDESRGERFVTHVDLTEPSTVSVAHVDDDKPVKARQICNSPLHFPQSRHSTADATFKALIKMDENERATAPRPDNNNIRTSPNATTIIELKESGSAQGQSSLRSDDTGDRKSLDFLQKKYEIMKQELCESRARIEELEQSLVVSD